MRRIFKMMGEILILSTLVVIMAVGVSAKENNISWTFRDDTKTVNTDELVHTARSSSACFPVFQCTLSAA